MTTLEAKYETGSTAAPEEIPFEAAHLPWGYGDDRIVALVRSPDSLYVYWEITDPAIARARKQLGAAGEHGWYNLRVYDTTGVAFDGVNAHGYFDVTVERGARDFFFDLKRPASSAHVEIGIKTTEGYFVAIARSGRADFPRKGPSPNHALEWMTVTSDDAPPAVRAYESKYVYRPPPPAPPSPPDQPQVTRGSASPPAYGQTTVQQFEERTWTWTHPATFEVRWEGPWLFNTWRTEWRIHRLTGTGADVLLKDLPWLEGPFMEHALDASRFEVHWLGEGPVVVEDHASGLQVLGPWALAIKGFSPEEHRTIATWRVHWTRVEPAKVERWWSEIQRVRVNAWERVRVVAGASEGHVVVEGGASEAWRLGASERRMGGASEWLALGASEIGWLGASERALGGASLFLFGGSSRGMFAGASSPLFQGASHAPTSDRFESWR